MKTFSVRVPHSRAWAAIKKSLWQESVPPSRMLHTSRRFDLGRLARSKPERNVTRFFTTQVGYTKPAKPVAPRRAIAYSVGLTTVLLTLVSSTVGFGDREDPIIQLNPGDSERLVVIDEQPHDIRLAEFAQHDAQAERKWVIYGTHVYDVTDFIEAHPGGDVILRACGRSIDPFWKMFKIHDSPAVRDILQQYYLGPIHPGDLDAAGNVNWTSIGIDENMVDPFWDDPKRDVQLVTHTDKPCNAETPAGLLTKWFITPTKYFFVRNHLWVPRIDPKTHSLTIELSDGEEMSISLNDIRSSFAEHTVTATLQCSGNRRKHMSNSERGKTSGLPWDVGAISTAEFTGVKLCDVLRHVGYDKSNAEKSDDKHIHFSSSADNYSVSIPLHTALSSSADVLLVYKMNGEAISRDHGGPLRVLVPGTTAARSVKWVGRLAISSEEAQGQYQRRDYKCFAPNICASQLSNEDWDREQSIQETPVQSAITVIEDKGGKVSLQGFAFSGGGRSITRVDVSDDNGKTWKRATIRDDDAKGSKRWAWSLWDADLPKETMGEGKRTYIVKATDDSYNTQPESFDSIWNFRGLLANAWHRVTLSEPVTAEHP